ncbi:hypothetical protein HYDPIDRAFT_32230 [Hydnomerulius pinastri MD-312]|uniref:Uncharacterized protein n=1 Tax=Hydnomerulius pinastri MD-312 TaxID=994086 RepID=A0A0C9WAD2_9AGAM|nr:hypothetical protein HYDPIDRAFT_32230 [Hydnomerulius pinastri MD-312]
MIKQALMLYKAIEKWVFEHKDLCEQLWLSNDDWKFLEVLCKTLEIFTNITFYMSRSKTPTLPWAIPMYHYMEKSLKLTCHFNILATICHPGLCLDWFKNFGDDGYLQAKLIFERFVEEYASSEPMSQPVKNTQGLPRKANINFLTSIASLHSAAVPADLQPSQSPSATPISHARSEIQQYAVLLVGKVNQRH